MSKRSKLHRSQQGKVHKEKSPKNSAPSLSERADLSRILALSDGVFAIVITLLVFELKVPMATSTGEPLTQRELISQLIDLTPKLASFAATFIVIGVYWTGHHGVFKHIIHYDRGLLWMNNLFLMCVSFMPFPTALLGTYWYTQVGVTVYGLSLFFSGASLALLWRYATNNRRLVEPNLENRIINLGHQRILIAPIAAMMSILVSTVSPIYSLWVYLFAGFAYLIPSRLDPHSYSKN